jgi:NADPH:quinone reductase-like Zn-dependent oxidoreductase
MNRNKVQPDDGTFGEYCIVKAGVAFKIPDNITDEEAATLGLGIATVVSPVHEFSGTASC